MNGHHVVKGFPNGSGTARGHPADRASSIRKHDAFKLWLIRRIFLKGIMRFIGNIPTVHREPFHRDNAPGGIGPGKGRFICGRSPAGRLGMPPEVEMAPGAGPNPPGGGGPCGSGTGPGADMPAAGGLGGMPRPPNCAACSVASMWASWMVFFASMIFLNVFDCVSSVLACSPCKAICFACI